MSKFLFKFEYENFCINFIVVNSELIFFEKINSLLILFICNLNKTLSIISLENGSSNTKLSKVQ